LWLIQNGVPFDVAWSLDDFTVDAWCIIFSELHGNEFDFNTMKFREPDHA